MKRLYTIVFLLLFCNLAAARPPEGRGFMRWGAEWGYGTSFYRYWNHNYMDPDLGRIFDSDEDFSLSANGYILLSAGADILPWLNISLYSGLMGISYGRQVVPLAIRANFFPKGANNDGLLLLAGTGIGFSDYFSKVPAHFANIGSGWRVAMNKRWDMDFTLQLRVCGDKPPIWDADRNAYVNESDIRGNIAVYCSIEFGIAISF